MKNSILLGTSNAGKLKEFKFYIKHFNIFSDFEIKTLQDLQNIKEPIEDGATFEENAKIKSNFFYERTKLMCLSDDSGFMVEGLKDYPGIKTSREAKELGGEQKVIDYIFSNFNSKLELNAIFYCTLAIIGGNKEIICNGRVKGKIISNKRGKKGFGYDPYFIPYNEQKTFAEMETDEKMFLSHRYDAFKILSNQIL